jgi:hypothetical protein
MDEQTRRDEESRFAAPRVISLDDASPELMEAQPGTIIRLSAAQTEQLQKIEGEGGGRFRRDGPQPERPNRESSTAPGA